VGEINGYIENLLEGLAGELTAKQRDYLMDMREIGMNNYRLICDFLNLSKIERGLMSATLQKIPVKDIVQLGLRDYESTIARKGLKLSLEGMENGFCAMADRDKMVETLRNLISNAIKFTDKGAITFRVEADEKAVRLLVMDTGPGISEVAMKQMFSQKRILGEEAGRAGAGIGLYIVKHFMEAQGGSVQVETKKGKGTTFTLVVPRAV
jgi:signal transduction histidine kinase